MRSTKTTIRHDEELRPLSTISATALVVGNMIGVGLFTTTGFLADAIGDPLLMLGMWLLGGFLALCGATVYAELGAMMPRGGGEYVYLSRAFHPVVGFLSGWVSLLVGFSAPIALTAHAFGIYLDAANANVPTKGAAALLIVVLTVLHALNVAWGSRLQTFLTASKIVLIVGFVGFAFLHGDGDWNNYARYIGNATSADFATGLVLVSFSYFGWNVAAYVGGEIKDPERGLPRALIWGTMIVTLLFFLLNASFIYAISPAELAQEPERIAYVASRALFGDVAGATVSVCIAVALMSSVSAMIMAGPRVYMAMAEDGLFFRRFAQRNSAGVPWVSLLVQSGIALIMLFTSTFIGLLTYIGVVLSVFSGLTILAAMILRRSESAANRPYMAFGWPISPLLYLALVTWMVISASIQRPLILAAGGGTLVIGGLLYVVIMRHARERKRKYSDSSESQN